MEGTTLIIAVASTVIVPAAILFIINEYIAPTKGEINSALGKMEDDFFRQSDELVETAERMGKKVEDTFTRLEALKRNR
jgi:hypothetical protein